jgi:hypothetical protein
MDWNAPLGAVQAKTAWPRRRGVEPPILHADYFGNVLIYSHLAANRPPACLLEFPRRWGAAGLRSSAYPCARIAGLAQQPAEHAWAKTVFGLYLVVKYEAGVISSAGNDAVIGMVVGATHRWGAFSTIGGDQCP